MTDFNNDDAVEDAAAWLAMIATASYATMGKKSLQFKDTCRDIARYKNSTDFKALLKTELNELEKLYSQPRIDSIYVIEEITVKDIQHVRRILFLTALKP